MKNELKINQLSSAAFAWYQEYLNAVDSVDTERYGQFLADDCEFQFGNNPIVKGKQAILEGLKKFWATYDSEEHILHGITGQDNYFALEATNVYQRKDGKKVSIPAVAITERNDQGLAKSIRVFIDIAPLYA
jgi:ketosteroid isomerase-like protein